MEGTWNLAHEEIVVIMQNGTADTLSVKENVGMMLLEPTATVGGSNVFLDFSLTLVNSNFRWVALPFKCDDARKRVFVYNFFCNDIFGCDLVCTIEKDTPTEQRWSFIKSLGNGQHRKTTWVLVKG